MRGDTDPDETATAQGHKNSWTASRLKDRQDEMARYCRDACRMAGEVVSSYFQIDMLQKCQLMMQQFVQAQAQRQQMQAQGGGQPQQPPQQQPPPFPDLGPTQE